MAWAVRTYKPFFARPKTSFGNRNAVTQRRPLRRSLKVFKTPSVAMKIHVAAVCSRYTTDRAGTRTRVAISSSCWRWRSVNTGAAPMLPASRNGAPRKPGSGCVDSGVFRSECFAADTASLFRVRSSFRVDALKICTATGSRSVSQPAFSDALEGRVSAGGRSPKCRGRSRKVVSTSAEPLYAALSSLGTWVASVRRRLACLEDR